MRLVAVLLTLVCLSGRGHAQVVEPNGVAVPLAPTTANEPSLQSYFSGRMPPEAIDVVRDASAEPATFSPLCDFQAELVMSASSASAGLAWYNVPADPNVTPTALYQVVPETTQIGATLSSADIRSARRTAAVASNRPAKTKPARRAARAAVANALTPAATRGARSALRVRAASARPRPRP